MVGRQQAVGYVVDEPDAEAEGGGVGDVGAELDQGVQEPGVARGEEAEEDGAGGEEEDECEGGEDGVRDEYLLAGGGGLGWWAEVAGGLAWVVAVGVASWAVRVSAVIVSSVTTGPSTVLCCYGVCCGCCVVSPCQRLDACALTKA